MQTRDVLTEKRLWELEEMVAEISPEELKRKMDEGEIFHLVEVSNQNDYNSGHLPGALFIPMSKLIDEANKRFQKFEQIVIYTVESNSSAGLFAVRKLQRDGFSNVMWLKEGKAGWKNAGYPLESEKIETETSDS
ncbi:MAG: hypothetical protein D6813_15360 [Calditrichaeota bacterium]|nr:MAG: hypothetical protein D6813_15360 [Calditrichota bacterium]